MFEALEYVKIRLMGMAKTERGASAVEYGLLVAGIAALVVGIVFLFGGVVTGSFQSTCDQVKSGGSSASQTCA